MMENRIRFKDKTLVCGDCGAEFTFSAGEQRYFFSKGLSAPKRCPHCRQQRRETLVRDEGVQRGGD